MEELELPISGLVLQWRPGPAGAPGQEQWRVGRRVDLDVLDAPVLSGGTAWGLRAAECGWQDAESAGITLREADRHPAAGAVTSVLDPAPGSDRAPSAPEVPRWWLVVVRHEGQRTRLRTDRGLEVPVVVVGPLAAAEWVSPPTDVTCWRGDQVWASVRVDTEGSLDVRYIDVAGQALARTCVGMLLAEAVELARAAGYRVRDLSRGGAFTQDFLRSRIDVAVGADGRVRQASHG